MNTTSLAKSMNSAITITDGELTIEGGQINFIDGSVLNSIGDIALKSASNTFTGNNTFNSGVNIDGVRIQGSDSQSSIIIDTNNGDITSLTTSTGENFIVGKQNLIAYNSTTANNNVMFGKSNFQATVTNQSNTAIGCNNFKLTTSNFNVGVGNWAFKAHTGTGDAYNIGIGYDVCTLNVSGIQNTAIGFNAGQNTLGSYNSFLGAYSGASSSNSYNQSTAIGYYAEITDSNQISLGRPNATTYVNIGSTEASSLYTNGALVVAGGVGVAGKVICNSEVQASSLSVSGLSSLNGGATITGLLKTTNSIVNKKMVIWDNNVSEEVASAVNFFGFGINGSTLRYQASMATEFHRFYCGSTLNLDVGNGTVNVPVALSVSGTSQFNSTATINQTSSLYFHDSYRGIKTSFTDTPFITSTSKPANGIAIWGYSDGCLGTTDGGTKSVLFWNNSSQVGINTMSPSYTLDVNGSLGVAGLTHLNGGMGADFKMNDKTIYLRSDTNHYIKYASGSWDGPVISGYYGGVLHSSSSNTQCLRWNTDGINIPLTTASTSPTTGAINVVGGVGIGGDLFCRNIRARAKGLGLVGPAKGSYTDFYTFPETGVYLFYINRCNANGAGVSSADGIDMNTARLLLISCANVQIITQLGALSTYIYISTGSTSLKLTAGVAIPADFTYTYWHHRLF